MSLGDPLPSRSEHPLTDNGESQEKQQGPRWCPQSIFSPCRAWLRGVGDAGVDAQELRGLLFTAMGDDGHVCFPVRFYTTAAGEFTLCGVSPAKTISSCYCSSGLSGAIRAFCRERVSPGGSPAPSQEL